MQTDSSASATYFASRSASECTTTVLMPISRHARWMRSAISPRLAIRILSNSLSGLGAAMLGYMAYSMTNSGWPNSTGWPFSTRIALIVAARVGLDLVHQLHRFDDAQRVAVRDGVADLDERRRARRRRAIERADHRALDHWPSGAATTAASARRRQRRAPGGGVGCGAACSMTVCWLGGTVRVMRTRSSPSWISSSAMPDVSTSSINVLSLRRSMRCLRASARRSREVCRR